MTTAFAGDPAVKAALLARIDRALADGSLSFAPGAGSRADPVAVSAGGGDVTDYARDYGYPLALTAALGIVAVRLDEASATRFVREWVSAVAPGADLSDVPRKLMLYLLDDPHLRAADAAITERLLALQADIDAAAADWTALRRAVVARADASTNPAERSAIAVWEEACWPVSRGGSVLVATFTAWQGLGGYADGWSGDREAAAFAALERIGRDHQASGDPDPLDYPAALRRADPDLARGFENNLTVVNQRTLDRARAFAAEILKLLAAA